MGFEPLVDEEARNLRFRSSPDKGGFELVELLTDCRNFLNRSSWFDLDDGLWVWLGDVPFVWFNLVARAARPFTCFCSLALLTDVCDLKQPMN